MKQNIFEILNINKSDTRVNNFKILVNITNMIMHKTYNHPLKNSMSSTVP